MTDQASNLALSDRTLPDGMEPAEISAAKNVVQDTLWAALYDAALDPEDFDTILLADRVVEALLIAGVRVPATIIDPHSNEPAQPVDQARYERAKARFFTASEHPPVVALRDQIVGLGMLIDEHVPPGRNQALALTALEDVQMRGNRGIFAPEGLR